jgi:sn1-specific diacylglycerol lipase
MINHQSDSNNFGRTLAPLNFGEYNTSGSLLAAHSSINVLSVFHRSSEASFSLASFITLVKRE